jgi:hypothetical protein
MPFLKTMARLQMKRNTAKKKDKSKPMSNLTPMFCVLIFPTIGMHISGVANIKYQHISPITSILYLFMCEGHS